LAYRDEVSSKADLSALDLYLPLSGDDSATVKVLDLNATRNIAAEG
jgi:hypothetical protein